MWRLIDGNNPDKPMTYMRILLASMPTQPEGSLLCLVRTWLVHRSPISHLCSMIIINATIDAMVAYAKTIGLPKGSNANRDTGGTLLTLGDGSRVSAADNDCNTCLAWICNPPNRKKNKGCLLYTSPSPRDS